MNKQDLDAIRERCERASKGPWNQKPNPLACAPEITNGEREIAKVLFYMGSEDREVFPNADFIAHARTDIPLLLAEIDRLQAERNAAVKDIPHNCDSCCGDDCGEDYFRDDCEKWQWRGLEGRG
jgi:hypothetical protein